MNNANSIELYIASQSLKQINLKIDTLDESDIFYKNKIKKLISQKEYYERIVWNKISNVSSIVTKIKN